MKLYWMLFKKEIRRHRGSYFFFLILTAVSLGTMLLRNPYYSGYDIALLLRQNPITLYFLLFYALLCVLFPAFLFVESLYEETRSRSIMQSLALPIPRFAIILSRIVTILSFMGVIYALAFFLSGISEKNSSTTWRHYYKELYPQSANAIDHSFEDRIADENRTRERNAPMSAVFGCSLLLLGITVVASTVASRTGIFRARMGYLTLFLLLALFAVYAYDTGSAFGSRTYFYTVFLSFSGIMFLVALYIFHRYAEA